jgi:hypothetical protein
MKFHVICEGSTDQIILEKIMKIVLRDSPEFIEPSNTQTKNRGVHSILIKEKLFPFLHYSFLNRANFIIICVDNDDDPIVNGCPIRYTDIKSYYNEFSSKYSISYNHRPSNCVIIPVKTIDYWVYAGKMQNAGPGTLRGIEDLPKVGIKEKVYGKENVMPFGIIPSAFQEILNYSITKTTIENNLKHLNSFLKFYNLLVRLN